MNKIKKIAIFLLMVACAFAFMPTAGFTYAVTDSATAQNSSSATAASETKNTNVKNVSSDLALTDSQLFDVTCAQAKKNYSEAKITIPNAKAIIDSGNADAVTVKARQ